MKRMDHLEHLDKHLVEELTEVARETIREELREQTRRQRRRATLYAASGAVALYAGGALAFALGLALDAGLPAWAAALITSAVLGITAYLLRGAARPHHPTGPTPEAEAELRNRAREDALRGPMPTGGPGIPYPPSPPMTTPQPESTPDPRQRPI
ncbi:phage holin family protein [Streptomyces roseirectus]|uniref:Phage holin family protein n=1 Tax=Streptomyces roseirectus TaxID=2768066 RepID=A0A7H0INM4_9ACTN|nr:phage holin family protein [Streptomyces roseirectus]QNP74390.1 phage holin family protein [Streptomyces roseirectus]